MKNKPLQVTGVSVAYANKAVVSGISFSLEEGEIGGFLGPSGCGKTTLLRAIAGFEPIHEGTIELGGRTVADAGFSLAPEKRRVGMVFQDFALFPHLSVGENIAFGLRFLSASERRERVRQLLRLVGLEQRERHFPHQLSGGQQQRVALARAMAPRPRILLMDEPFSSLDVELRGQLASEVRTLLKEDGITAILVTHDQLEAFAVADRVGVMNQGQLQQWDKAYNLYHVPETEFVADFIGQGVLLNAQMEPDATLLTPMGRIRGDVPERATSLREVRIMIRPDDLVLKRGNGVKAVLIERTFRGAEFLYRVRLQDGSELECLMPSHTDFTPGEMLSIQLDLQDIVLFDPLTGKRIRSEADQGSACMV